MNKKCPKCALVNYADADVCKRCGEKLLTAEQMAYRAQMATVQQGQVATAVARLCTFCGGTLMLHQETTKESQGCLFLIIGLVFAPFLIGIPILIYGFMLGLKREPIWKCSMCSAKA